MCKTGWPGRCTPISASTQDRLRPGCLYVQDKWEPQALDATDIIFVRASEDPEETALCVRLARKYSDHVIVVEEA